jgi:hypothetical protein
MIEDYYGHITPAKNAERILQGYRDEKPIADGSGERAASVNDWRRRNHTRETPNE